MSSPGEFCFDPCAVENLAGSKVFARGEAYFREGRVRLLDMDADSVIALVSGTEDYRAQLTGRGGRIGGACSCPAFDDWGFCKHLVAVALAANVCAREGRGDAPGPMGRIRAYLAGLSAEALAEVIIGVVERDPALFRELDIASALIGADEKALEARLTRAIDDAISVDECLDYRGAGNWAAEVALALSAIDRIAMGEHAGLAFSLAERALRQIAEAIEATDDSQGLGVAMLAKARDIHLAAAVRARPDPVELAQDLFEREMDDDYGVFTDAGQLYGEALGEKGLAEYRRLAEEAWAALPPRTGTQCGQYHHAYNQLASILDLFALEDGDLDARVALRAKDLSSPYAYFQLAEFCVSHGRDAEALRHAEEGLWMFEDARPDARLVRLGADLLAKAGRSADAEANLRRAFERHPSLEFYEPLRVLAGKAARDQAVGVLEARLAGGANSDTRATAEVLIRILIREQLFDAAWSRLRRHGGSAEVKAALAEASEATHPAQAIAVYAEQVDHLAGLGGERAYASAAALVDRMAALRGEAEQGAYIADLQARFGRRRNFMRLLEPKG